MFLFVPYFFLPFCLFARYRDSHVERSQGYQRPTTQSYSSTTCTSAVFAHYVTRASKPRTPAVIGDQSDVERVSHNEVSLLAEGGMCGVDGFFPHGLRTKKELLVSLGCALPARIFQRRKAPGALPYSRCNVPHFLLNMPLTHHLTCTTALPLLFPIQIHAML